MQKNVQIAKATRNYHEIVYLATQLVMYYRLILASYMLPMLPSGLTWELRHFCGIFYKSVYFFKLISNIDAFTFDESK